MKIGEKLEFKRVRWILTEKRMSFPAMVEYWQYKVYRKYWKVWLNNTDCTYCIFPHRWKALKKELKENKNFHYTQMLGIGDFVRSNK